MPKAGYNLFILTHRIYQGCTLGGDTNAIWLTKVDQQVKFNIKIKTPKVEMYVIYINIKGAENEEVVTLGSDEHNPIKAKVAHAMLCHINEVDRRRSARHLGYEISRGVMNTYKPCAEAKEKQKSLPTM